MYYLWSTRVLLFAYSLSFLVTDFIAQADANLPSLQQPKPLCHDEEKFALLQFKQSFDVNCLITSGSSSYPKAKSWQEPVHVANGTQSGDCCSWDGVKCDEQSGHVVGLDLSSSCLYGPFPPDSTLFSLHHLLELNLARNHFSYSQIPLAIGQLVKLTSLDLSDSAFSGLIPYEISKLSSLNFLDLSLNDLHVFSLEKLVLNFTGLRQLHLDYVDIPSVVPHILSNRTSLKAITLRYCNLFGEFPASILQLPNLEKVSLDSNSRLRGHLPEFQSSSPLKYLSLSNTSFTGKLPTSIGNLDSLNVLNLTSCKFSGSIPSSLGNLTRLTYLTLDQNHFSGDLPSSIVKLTRLSTLTLSNVTNARPAMLISWLPKLNRLTQLRFSNMKLRSEILPAVTNLTRLTYLVIQDTDIGQIPDHLLANLTQLTHLDLSNNLLRGRLPIPPSSLQVYDIHNNSLHGSIPEQMCHSDSLIYLGLSYNSLHGKIPSCIIGDQLGNSLKVLKLNSNKFSGTIPDSFSRTCKLQVLRLGQNQLEGMLPKSLAHCTMLRWLDLRSNRINDTLPSWLTSLPKLIILVLSYNNFHGRLPNPVVGRDFRCLAIFDVASNFYVGEIPTDFFQGWRALKPSSAGAQYYDDFDPSDIDYRIYSSVCYTSFLDNEYYNYGINGITGEDLRLSPVSAIDFSSNRFTGRIPEISRGNSGGLVFLSISNNLLVGCIPSSLGSLNRLEILNLSRNRLSGKIPQELTQLTFLEVFDVSHNQLVGPVPQGQFNTFAMDSYDGNPALCGDPLPSCGAPVSYSCENTDFLPSSKVIEDGTKLVDRIVIFVSIGCVSGFTIGFVLGKFYVTDARYHDWFVQVFGKWRRANTRARRSRN